jgi:hypothetical protein
MSKDPAYGEHVVPPVESVEHEQHDRPLRQQTRAPRDRALKAPRRDR